MSQTETVRITKSAYEWESVHEYGKLCMGVGGWGGGACKREKGHRKRRKAHESERESMQGKSYAQEEESMYIMGSMQKGESVTERESV